MFNHKTEFIKDPFQLQALIERLEQAEVIALDIETMNWWDRQAERISIIQLAFRQAGTPQVAIIDALGGLELGLLRRPLELGLKIKAIHNASFDAVRMARHLQIATSPIHDTMLAARRAGEKKCSLKAQVETHLSVSMDKGEQRSDWSRRPLSVQQLEYAALDAVCTLMLYELQIARGMRGDYQLPEQYNRFERPIQSAPMDEYAPFPFPAPDAIPIPSNLSPSGFALLGIVTELQGRYSPEQLSVSVGGERIGMAGWIIDRVLGPDADLEETVAQQDIAWLIEHRLLSLSLSRRLEATSAGAALWREKSAAS
jgi:hypothetical protein